MPLVHLVISQRWYGFILTCSHIHSCPSRAMAVMDQAVGITEEEDGEAVMTIECQTLVVVFVRSIGQVRNWNILRRISTSKTNELLLAVSERRKNFVV